MYALFFNIVSQLRIMLRVYHLITKILGLSLMFLFQKTVDLLHSRKLDESTARWHQKSPWSLSVRSSHLNFQSYGHIWGLEFNRYVCFSFHGNQTIVSWDIANSIFDLKNSMSRSWPRSYPNDLIWGIAFNRFVCCLFRGNRTVFGWDISNSRFDLEVSFPETNLKFYEKICQKNSFEQNLSKT